MTKPFQVHVPLLELMPEALATKILAESPIPTERLQVAAALGFRPAELALPRRSNPGSAKVTDEPRLSAALEALGALGGEARLRAGLAMARFIFWVYEHETHCTSTHSHVPRLIDQALRSLDTGSRGDLKALEKEAARLKRMHERAREGEVGERHFVAALEARDDQRALVALVDSVLDVAPDTEWPPKAEAHGATLRYLASAMLPWLLEGDWSTAPEAGDG